MASDNLGSRRDIRVIPDRTPEPRYPYQDRLDQAAPLSREASDPPRPSYSKLIATSAVVGLTALVFRGGRSELAARTLDLVGERGRALREVLSPYRGAINEVLFGNVAATGARRGRYGSHIPEPDLVRDIERAMSDLGVLGPAGLGYRTRGGSSTTGRELRAQFAAAYRGRAPENLVPLTVGDALRQAQGLSPNSIRVLQEGLQRGFVEKTSPLSRSGRFGLFKDASGRIVNTQWAAPDRLLEAAHHYSRAFSLGGFHPSDLIFGVVRPLVHRPLTATLGDGKLLPNGARTGRLFNLAIGDTAYSLIPGRREFQTLATGLRLYETGIPGGNYLARQGEAITGELGAAVGRDLRRLPDPGLHPFRHLFGLAQRISGVGPSYRTEDAVLSRVINAWRRGRGTFVPHEFTALEDQLSWVEKGRLRLRHGDQADDVLKEAVPNRRSWADMGWWERTKARIGSSRLGEIHVGQSPVGVPVNPIRTSQGRTAVPAGVRVPVGAAGQPADSLKASGVFLRPGDLPHVLLHHSTERLNTLMGATFGIGFRPTAGRWGWMGNLAKIYGAGYAAKMGLEYLKYADYVVDEVTPGPSPSELLVSAYAEGNLARQRLRETLGIAPAARYAEDLMPGSTTLPGSWLLRTLGPIAAGALRGGPVGASVGGAVSMLIGGTDLGAEPAELERIYTGDKLVPVRRGRWWAAGLQPWSGDKVDYYRPHWVARFLSNYKYSDVQYGSKGEYFAHRSEALTPHNLFGLTKVLDPEYYSRKHEDTRPYPYSETGRRMHEGEEVAPLADRGVAQAIALGGAPSPGTYLRGADPTSLTARGGRALDHVTELGGIYKFLAEQIPFYEDLFGQGRGGSQKYAARANTITSGSREYYDEALGGLLGLSEFPRRLMDVDRGEQGINLIPNQMPGWVPGVRSLFERDRQVPYPLDLTLGDPYAKIRGGEYRLPGPGYESVRPLHSGIPGAYDAVDRYLILADVAPWSEAFRHYEAIVTSWRSAGVLDSSWERRVGEAEQQVSTKLYGDHFTPRVFSGTRSGTLEELAKVNQYSGPERVLGATWEMLTHDVVPAAGRSVPILGTMFDRKLFGQRSALESFEEDQVYGVEWQDWRHPYRSFIRPKIDTLIASNPAAAVIGGAGTGLIFGPFVGATAALGLGAASTVRMVATGESSGGYVPSHVEEERRLQEYFDALQYLRMTGAQQLAVSQGQGELASEFRKEAGRTVIGMNVDAPPDWLMTLGRSRLGPQMRFYVRPFMEATGPAQAEIRRLAPPMSIPLFESAWAQRVGGRAPRRRGSPRDRAEQIVAMYGTPGNNWAGWSPAVPMKSIKVKTMDAVANEAYDHHHFDLWEADRAYTARTYPELQPAFDNMPVFPQFRMRLRDRVREQLDPFSLIEPVDDLINISGIVHGAEELIESLAG